MINPKIEQLETAEASIKEFAAREEEMRNEALLDGIIDADEQADLDRVRDRIEELRNVVSTLRNTLEENRRIWDALESAREEWAEQLTALREAGRPDLATFDVAELDLASAVDEQRWADATEVFNETREAMRPVYAAYREEMTELVAAGGDGAPDAPPPEPTADPAQDEWNSVHAEYQGAMTSLERHAQAGAAPIAAAITAIKSDATAAESVANGGDSAGATTTMRTLVTRCAETEDQAHEFAEYQTIQTARAGLVNGNAAVGEALIDDIQTEMEQLLADATTDANAGNYGDAITKLNRIPPLADRRTGMIQMRTNYGNHLGWANWYIPRIEAHPDDVRQPFQSDIDSLKAEFEAARIENTQDYTVSTPQMQEVQLNLEPIDTMLQDVAGYTADLAAFDIQFEAVRDHPERQAAIEEFFQARQLDRDRAEADAAARRYPTARALLTQTSAAEWQAQIAVADAHTTYVTNRETAEAMIEEVRAIPGTEDLIAQADDLMTMAASQAAAGDIADAEVTLTEAQTRAEDARAAAQAQEALGALHDEDALNNAAEDFAAAMAVYTDMRDNVAGQDDDGAFTTQIDEANTLADDAQAMVDNGGADMDAVRAKLDEAIALLQEILPQVSAYNLYQDHLTEAQTLVASITTLNTANDTCIQGAVDACNTLLADAQGLAGDPTRDFAGAEAKLTELTERGRAAQDDVATYTGTIQPNTTAIDAAIAQIAGAVGNVPNRMAATTTRLTNLKAEITTALSAEDFAEAVAKSNEGATAAGAVAQDIGICQTIDSDFTNWITNAIGPIGAVGGATATQPEVQSHLDRVNTGINEFNDLMTAGSYRSAAQKVLDASFIIDDGVEVLQLLMPYNNARDAARDVLDDVKALVDAGTVSTSMEEQYEALNTRYEAAVALVTEADGEPQLATATTRLNDITPEANALLTQAQSYGNYDAARTPAEAKLTEAESHAQIGAIETTVTMLRAKFDNAEELADSGEITRAIPVMGEVESGATEAIENANNVEIFAGISEAIGDSSSDSSGPTMAHIAAARLAHGWQAGKENASVAQAELDEASAEIDRAEDGSVPAPDQTTSLENAMQLITRAGEIISQHELLTQTLADARTRLGALQGHAQAAYLATQLTEMSAGIDAAEAGATDLAALPGCAADVERIMENVEDYQTRMDAQQEYVDLRPTPEVEPRLAQLEGHAAAYSIQTNIDAIRSKLDDAARLSDQLDPVAAVERLNEVKTLGLSAFVMAEMQAGTPPSKDSIREILNGPGGEAELDAMIDTLPAEAQRDVLTAAFEVRFGCTLTDLTATGPGSGDMPAPDIRRFYEIMSDLPTNATMENDSLRTFQISPAGAASSWLGGQDNIIDMQEGPASTSAQTNFGTEAEVGQVDPGCEPANDEPVSNFTWNTLHEVGHAVDDQHGFMTSRAGNAAFGGWTEHGANTNPIADVLAAHFDYDRSYIIQAMGQRLAVPATPGNPAVAADADPTPPAPNGVEPEVWESRRVAFAAWLNRVREPREPWMSNATAQQVAIDGVVYHEAYTDSWVSYNLAARSKGMTGYQFRSPAEWFSELYAAYHSGKIKGGHPAEGWLSGLDNPETM